MERVSEYPQNPLYKILKEFIKIILKSPVLGPTFGIQREIDIDGPSFAWHLQKTGGQQLLGEDPCIQIIS